MPSHPDRVRRNYAESPTWETKTADLSHLKRDMSIVLERVDSDTGPVYDFIWPANWKPYMK